MSLPINTTFRVFLEKLGGSNPSEFIGNSGEIFLDPSVPTLKLSDGSTPGGVDIGGGGGIGGGIGTDGSVNTTGIITASSFSGTTATFSGNISVGGTLTYDDVTNVDSIGLITARTGIEVLSGIVTTPKLHVDSVGSGFTFSEDLVVQGNARVTGILSIGTSSIVLDSNAKVIRGVEQIRINSTEQNENPIIIKQSNEKIVFVKTEEVDGEEVETDQEASVGIGSTANISTTGIITASSFVGDGSGLTNLPSGGGGIGTDGSVNTTGIITAASFFGDGSGLTNLPSGGGGSSFFVQNATGIHTLSNVGIGTTNATETLTVDGTIGMPLGNVLIGGYNVGSSLQPDVGNYDGTSNVFIGNGQNAGEYAAGQYTTTGSGNVFVGPGAGQENTTGFNNVYIGSYTGQYATTASDNICLGLLAGSSIDGTGSTDGRTNNIFMGRRSGVTNTTGTNNTFLGFNSGYDNTTGSYNTFIGHDAGRNSTTGDNNVFIGQDAGLLNTTGYNNVFIGQDAGRSHSTGQYNCSIGKDAGRSLTDGFDNTFIGKEAGKDTTEGFYNTFIGSNAGQYNTEAYGNIFIGQFTGQYTTGLNSYQNTMIGGYCGTYNTGGYYNVFLGAFSGENNTTGYYNIFLGTHAGQTNTTGVHNICIGDRTLSSTTASYKIILGQGFTDADRFDSPDTNSDYQFAVGIRTDSNQSQYWLVGDENFNIGINSTAPTAKLDVLGDVRVGNSNSQGIILTSPNGTQYRLVVANDGTLSTSAV